MAIYTGIGGVVKQLSYMDAGRENVIRPVVLMKCGIDGVVRDLIDTTTQIDHIAIVINQVSVGGNDVTASVFSTYATITITSTYLNVAFKNSSETVILFYDVYVVFKDGQRALLKTLLNINAITSFRTTVTGYEAGNGVGANQCLGNTVSGSTIITGVNTDWFGWGRLGAWSPSGGCTIRQTFSSFTINGVGGFSTVILNELS